MAPRLVGGDAVWLINKVQLALDRLKKHSDTVKTRFRHSPNTATTMSRHGQDRVQTDPYTYTVNDPDMDIMIQSQSIHVQDMDHKRCGHAPDTI